MLIMNADLPNPFHEHTQSMRAHRRQFRLQILLPIILITLAVVAVIVLLIILSHQPGGAQTHTLWADISLIWILIPIIFIYLLTLVLIGGLVYGMSRLNKRIPHYGALGQYYAYRMTKIAYNVADKASAPVIKVRSWQAGWQTLRRRVGKKISR